MEYSPTQLDRDVVAPDQIRTIIRSFRDRLFSEIFPGRKEVPKTLVFAKDDSHAEDIVEIIRQEFGKGDEFCKKITYKTTGEKPEDLIASFRNSYNPRIAVSVDMIATGTDIKPLECLLFMRNIRSSLYFEQMKGRGTRVIDSTDFEAVTPDAKHKTHFVIVDAIGVCETDKTDTRPFERKKSIPFEKLVRNVALGMRDEDTISSLAGRLARLDREIDQADSEEIKQASGGKNLRTITNGLLNAIDPDKQQEKARETFQTTTPTEEQIKEATKQLTNSACQPFDDPEFRNKLIDIKKKNEQVIDNVSQDEAILTGFDKQAKDKAQTIIGTFKQFIEDNKDEITALQLLFSKPFGQRHLTHKQITELVEQIKRPPVSLDQKLLWRAYEKLEKSKVRGANIDRLLTDMISLLRFTIAETDVLEPFSNVEDIRFKNWLDGQKTLGKEFSSQQLEWLIMIKDHITTSLKIEMDDFEYTPFQQKGGAVKAYQLFGDKLNKVLEELNEVLAA